MLGAFKFQLASRGPPIGAAGQLNLPTPSWTLESVWEGAPDYPRVCGATQVRGHAQAQAVGLSPRVRATDTTRADHRATSGLSPRVRGNHSRPARLLRRHRSIPACAGQPLPDFRSPHAVSVYPRVCGATLYRERDRVAHCGLSPRVRGNPVGRFLHPFDGGSIPACAGQPR